MSFSPGQPSSHQPLTSSLPTSDPSLLHAPILFYREKEGNVWAPCLLLGVSSDGFNHPWVPSSSCPPVSLLLLLLLSALSPHPPPATSLSSEMLLLPCLFFSPCLLSVRVRSEQCHWISRGPCFFLVPSVCDGHEWAVWSVSFFLLVPLIWMHFYIAYIVISSSHLVWPCMSVVCCAEQVGLFSHRDTTDSEGASVDWAILWGGQDRVGCMDLTAPVCVLSHSVCPVYDPGSCLCVLPVYDSLSVVCLLTNILSLF